MPFRLLAVALLLAPLAAGADELRAAAPEPFRLATLHASWLTGLPNQGELDLAVDVPQSLYLDLGLQRLDGWGGSVVAGWRTSVVDRRDSSGRGENVDARMGAGLIRVPQHVVSGTTSTRACLECGRGPELPTLATVSGATGARAVASLEPIFWLEPHLGAGLLVETGLTYFPGRRLVYGPNSAELPTPAGAIAPELRLAATVAF